MSQQRRRWLRRHFHQLPLCMRHWNSHRYRRLLLLVVLCAARITLAVQQTGPPALSRLLRRLLPCASLLPAPLLLPVARMHGEIPRRLPRHWQPLR